MKIFKFLAIVCIAAMSTMCQAQTAEQPWAIGINVGKTSYNGDLGKGFFRSNQPFNGNIGFQLSRFLSPTFNIALNGTMGKHGYEQPISQINDKALNGTNSTTPIYGNITSFTSSMRQANVMLDFKMNNGWLLPADFKLAPFISAGVGIASFSPVFQNGVSTVDFVVPLGGGLNYMINDTYSMYWQSMYGHSNGDEVDGIVTETSNIMGFGGDDWWLNQIGLKVNIGTMADSDGDGISDKKDTCPDVPGLATFMGCPDSDNDGIEDSKDNCPNASGMAIFNGCPDSDNDGVMDKEDACPNEKGMLQFKGCPDTDGDGVANNLDKCPSVKGVLSNNGCPEAKPKVVTAQTLSVFRQALEGVQFETAQAVLKSNSFMTLNKVVEVMNQNPEMKLTIEGHTDAQGDENNNLKLSQQRADAVKTYLTSKGVSPMRMIAVGYGETKPISDNNTRAGRAKNRRVEFKAAY